jgi:hypothetical protein
MRRTAHAVVLVILALALTSCIKPGTPAVPAHPNQINVFDGQAYDVLISAQAALTQAKTLAPQFPQYKAELNMAIAAYNAAQAAYKAYHTAASPTPASQAALQAQLMDVVAQVGNVLKVMGVKIP